MSFELMGYELWVMNCELCAVSYDLWFNDLLSKWVNGLWVCEFMSFGVYKLMS
jgi:hypothetical protein